VLPVSDSSLALLPGGRDGGLFEAAAGVSSGVVERKVDSSFIAWSTHGQNCLGSEIKDILSHCKTCSH
jgi:hypothetical protein